MTSVYLDEDDSDLYEIDCLEPPVRTRSASLGSNILRRRSLSDVAEMDSSNSPSRKSIIMTSSESPNDAALISKSVDVHRPSVYMDECVQNVSEFAYRISHGEPDYAFQDELQSRRSAIDEKQDVRLSTLNNENFQTPDKATTTNFG